MNVKLTNNQLQELRDLIPNLQHPKLKKLLKRAIESWKTHKAGTGTFGILDYNCLEEGSLVLKEYSSCCLIGAGVNECKLLSQDNNDRFYRPVWSICGASREEFKVIWNTFDGRDTKMLENHPKESVLINEVAMVRKICFGV